MKNTITPVLGITADCAKKRTEEYQKNTSLHKNNNLLKMLAYANSKIKEAADLGNCSVKVLFPISPDQNLGNDQWKKKNGDTFLKNGVYDQDIVRLIQKEGFLVDTEMNTDNMTGVKTVTLTISWE